MISVILCTYNRCKSLAAALESVATSRLPASVEWEVVVVDNNSNDQTRVVAEEFAVGYPGRFRYLFEPKPGKSQALNSGVAAARGDVLAFMDDDVSVDPNWLDLLTAPLRGASEWSGSGGPVTLVWSCPPPRWLDTARAYSNAPLASFNLGEKEIDMPEPPFGTNMAFRKSMFRKYGKFRTDLGPSPRTDIPRPNEDTEFGRRLISGGERLCYVPGAIVNHPVPEERLKKEYFLNWWYDKGRADIREWGIPSGSVCVRGVPIHVLRRLAVWALRWMVAITPGHRFDCKLKVWGKLGEIAESRRQFAGFRRPKNDPKKDRTENDQGKEKEKVQCATVV
ncbi:MAG TPA: glycosyltransferase family A protein [Candidatus Sulfotelmatobacter sp.]